MDKYKLYEAEKQALDKEALPWEERERRLQEISRKHGI